MSEENKAIVRRAYQAMNQGDLETLEGLIADDMIEHDEFPGLEPNKAGVIQFFKDLRVSFPDLTMTAEDMVSERDLVFVRAAMAGTHKGEFLGASPTGRSIRVPMADFVRVSGGQIVEHWGITDTDAMRAQLGLGEE